MFLVVGGNAIHDFLVCSFQAVPTQHLDPFTGIEVFVMLEEVFNRLQTNRIQVGVGLPATPPSSSIFRMPRALQGTTTPGGRGTGVTTSTSTGSPSPEMV